MIAYDDCKHHSQCVRLLKPTFGRQLDTWRIITALFVPGGVHDMTDQWWDVQAYESTTDVFYCTLLHCSILLHTVLHTWTTLPTTYLTLPYTPPSSSRWRCINDCSLALDHLVYCPFSKLLPMICVYLAAYLPWVIAAANLLQSSAGHITPSPFASFPYNKEAVSSLAVIRY